MSIIRLSISFITLLVLSSCAKTTSTATSSGSTGDLTSAISMISAGVSTAGSGLSTSILALSGQHSLLTSTVLNSTMCGTHGEPQMPSAGGDMNQSDERFPFVHTYCAMTTNDGDTVRGGFALVEGLICSLEKGGIEFAGATQSITINFTDTECWPHHGPGGPSGPSSGTISAIGSAPASFNTHFDKGVIFTFSESGDTLTFKVAANLSATSIEFIAHEAWTLSGNTGVMAGKLNKTTGHLQFEKRDERIHTCSGVCSGSEGWNRHTRLFANLVMSSGEPTGLNSISYGFADLQADNPTTPTNGYGQLITASGSLSDGIKARLFINNTSSTSKTDLQDVTKWIETTNSRCMNAAGIDADGSTCTVSNTGINAFTGSTQFALYSTSMPQLSPAAWLAAYSGFLFNSVNLDTDNP